ncbi:MAG TPA: YlxR family protein [Methylomirabilota bacterium]
MKDGPGRTCLGCRQVKPKRELARLVREPSGIVVLDVEGIVTGRGAYVCADTPCVERALSRARLTHAFRRPCEAGPGLAEEVRRLWQRRK